MNQNRAILRRQLRQRRRDLPAVTRIAAAESLAQRILALPFLDLSMAFIRRTYAGRWWFLPDRTLTGSMAKTSALPGRGASKRPDLTINDRKFHHSRPRSAP